MATVAELLVKITADVDELKSGLKGGESSFDSFASKATSALGTAGKLLAGFGAATIVGLAAVAKASFDAASELEATEAKYNTVFKGMTDDADAFIEKFQQLTPATTASARSMASGIQDLLVPMGFVREEATAMTGEFFHAIGALTNFNSATHTAEDVTTAVQAAITGEYDGLKRLGIQLDATSIKEKAVEQGLAKTTDEVTKQDQAMVLLDEIYKQSGDALAAYNIESLDTKTKLLLLKASLTDTAAEIGAGLLPVVNDLMTVFREFADAVLPSVTNLFQGIIGIFTEVEGSGEKVTEAFGEILDKVIPAITKIVPKLVTVGIELIEALIEGIVDNLPEIVQAALDIALSLTTALLNMLPTLLETGAAILIQLIKGIAAALPTLIPQIVSVFLQMVQIWYDNLPLIVAAGLELLKGLAQGIIDAIPILVDMLPEIIDSLVDFFLESLPLIIETGVELLVALIGALPEIIKGIVAVLPDLIDGIIGGIINNIDLIIGAGIDLFVALIENIPAIVTAIVEKLPEIIDGIVGGIEDLFWKLVDVGEDLLKSIWQGIKDTGKWLWDQVSGFFGGLVDDIWAFLKGGSPSKLFMDFGESMAQGLGIGFVDSMRATTRQIASFGPRIAATAASLIPATNMTIATAGAYNVTGATPAAALEPEAAPPIYITINGLAVREEADVQKISAQLYRLQQDRLRQRGFNI